MNGIKKRFCKITVACIVLLFPFTPLVAVKAPSFIVVLDAGHGGKDPGAVNGKSYEKDINLGVVLALGEMIEKNHSDVSVVYTRNKDVYLTLQERADIANKAHADLFISIHTNANNNKEAFGTETYTLGLTKSQSNLDVAMRENSVILLEDDYKVKYAGFDPNSPDSYIMFECIQDRFLDKSIEFASEVQKNFTTVGRKDRGVRQAGFWVLHKTAMPSVLVEVGYLSNDQEKKFLISTDGQKKMAEAIYGSFDRFKKEYDLKSGNQLYNSPSKPAQEVAEKSNKSRAKPETQALPEMTKPTQENSVASNKLTKEEEASTQQFLDKMKTEAKVEEAKPSNEKTQVTKTAEPKVEPIIELPTTVSIPKEFATPAKTAVALPITNVNEVSTQPVSKAVITTASDTLDTKSQAESFVFKLQLFAVSKEKPKNDISFKGLQLDYYQEAALFIYTYGNTTEYTEIVQLKKDIASKFPDAKIIAFMPKELAAQEKSSVVLPKTKDSEVSTQPVSKAVVPNTSAPAVTKSQAESFVFKLQLFAVSKEKPKNDTSFKGLQLDYYQEAALFKYTYGNTTEYTEIVQLKKSIASKFPDAIIIAFKNGRKVPLSEALK